MPERSVAHGPRPRRAAAASLAMLGALVVLASTGACTHRSANDPGRPSPSASPRYHAGGIDLCRKADLAPLADLSLTIVSTKPGQPAPVVSGAEGNSYCDVDLRGTDLLTGLLSMDLTSPGSAEQADREVQSWFGKAGYRLDTEYPGIGNRAVGFSIEKPPENSVDLAISDYMIVARSGNLKIRVDLQTSGRAVIAKSTLSAVVLAIVKTTLPLVPKD